MKICFKPRKFRFLKFVIENIINILIEKHEQDLLNYLTTIFKYYYFILRYLVNNSNFPYDIIMQFHSGIKNNF